jgi:hypothetical protein
MNTVFLTESLKIVVAIFCHLSDNGRHGDGSGKAYVVDVPLALLAIGQWSICFTE